VRTGSSPAVGFVLANPDSGEKVYQDKLEGRRQHQLGSAVAVGQVAGRDLALVGGIDHHRGASGYGVAVVDIGNPRAFEILAGSSLGTPSATS
jgi:hypothetical protein